MINFLIQSVSVKIVFLFQWLREGRVYNGGPEMRPITINEIVDMVLLLQDQV